MDGQFWFLFVLKQSRHSLDFFFFMFSALPHFLAQEEKQVEVKSGNRLPSA